MEIVNTVLLLIVIGLLLFDNRSVKVDPELKAEIDRLKTKSDNLKKAVDENQ